MASKKNKKKQPPPLIPGKLCSICNRRVRIGETFLRLMAMSHTEDGPREFLENDKSLIHIHYHACSPTCARAVVERMSERYLKEHHV